MYTNIVFDISTVEIKKPRTLETSEVCNSYNVHRRRTHNTVTLFYDQSNSGYQWCLGHSYFDK